MAGLFFHSPVTSENAGPQVQYPAILPSQLSNNICILTFIYAFHICITMLHL